MLTVYPQTKTYFLRNPGLILSPGSAQVKKHAKILAHPTSLWPPPMYYFPADFTPEVHVSLDKFLQNLAWCLAERYR
ncbi:hypothetical protein NFI96_008106 [Prochilodus magdalenae]|nr:hypothetical protein NFI96_008106 [Prochilodus magdalenae]